MKTQHVFSAITAAALTAAGFAGGALPAQTGAAENHVTVMCIGDSITDGYGTAGSYRKFLYHGLTENGYSVEMTGDSGENGTYFSTYTDADGTSFQYDDDHSGHSGYSILSYNGRSGIYEQIKSSDCLAKYQPDIVILQIGTNDAIDNHELSTAGERLEVLIRYILGELPDGAQLFVTEIPDVQPNRSDVYTWFNGYRYSETWEERSDAETAALVKAGFDLYNQKLTGTVRALMQEFDNISLCHVNSTLTDLDAQLKDGVHPNDAGYARMGAYWTEQLTQYLSGAVQQTDVTTSTATTTTTTSTETTTTTTSTTTVTNLTGHTPLLPVTGDVDGDGTAALADAVLLQKFLVGKGTLTDAQMIAADLDSNMHINAKDLTLLKRLLMK